VRVRVCIAKCCQCCLAWLQPKRPQLPPAEVEALEHVIEHLILRFHEYFTLHP
jgi:hypothetical protein